MKLQANLIFVIFVMMVAACRDGDGSVGRSYDLRVSQEGREVSIRVEVASTPEERQKGLMHRDHLDEDAGMLFLFAADGRGGFWMRNTLVPLDIAYVGADGRVQEVRAAKPLDETILTPAAPYRYVLEVNQGWFERHGLGVGALLTLPDGLPAPR